MTRLYIILGVAAVALIVLLVIYFRNKKKARTAAALEADAGLAPGGDDISLLIHEAETKLAAAKLGQSARVGHLPVYLIIGDPGTTKTSVMLHSGLEPELLSGQIYQAGNVTATRTANLWFSRRSLFIEAGGQLLADANKWRALVKRLQPRSAVLGKAEQPGRAVVVCFDCENFTKAGSVDLVANAARNLRARLGEISHAMGINLPVYALFTKTDRLPFFTDYVRNLNNEEATQVLGVTLPMVDRRTEGVYAEQETTRLTGFFEQLFRSLADGRPEFLSREGDAAKLPGTYEFPREFRKIRPALVQFLVDLCRPSQLTVGPFLRGFYFTGVRPVIINEAAPVAAAPQQQQGYGVGGAAAATGIFRPGGQPGMQQAQPAPPPILTTRKVPQWLFLSHLFNDVLLADKAAMGASGASIKVSGARRILYAAAASLCFLLTVFLTISFFNNLAIESRVKAAVKGMPPVELAGTDLAPTSQLERLDALRQELEKLLGWKLDSPPLFYRWGLYVGDDVYRAARPVYCSRFRQLLLKQTQAGMVSYLRGPNLEYRPAYDALRAYLITTTHPGKSDSQLPPVLMRWWMNDRTPEPERQRLARAQFDFYQKDLLIENPCTTTPQDALAVETARAFLKRQGGAQRVYLAMLNEANKKFPPVNFNKQFPGSEHSVIATHEVPGAFTRDGWKFMTGEMAHPERYLKGEGWVLGDEGTSNIDLARVALEIKPLYLADYLKEWRAYLQNGRVLRYANLNDASVKLKQLSDNQSPLLEFIGLASTHTAVDDPKVSSVFQSVQTVVPPDKQNPYVQGANQPYMGSLVQLQISVDGAAKQLNDSTAGQTLNDARSARIAMASLTRFPADLEGHSDTNVKKLLEDPITYAEALVRGADAADLNAKGAALCRQMAPLYTKYPFDPKARAEVSLQEFSTILKPNEGALWQFVNANMQKVVTRQGSQFVPNASGGVKVDERFLRFLNRALAFTDATFKDNANEPHLTYQLHPLPSPDIESVTMVIDGQKVVFTGAAAAKQFPWPAAGTQNVQLTARFKGGKDWDYPNYDGLWSIFRFVTEADTQSGNRFVRILGSGNPKRANTDPNTGHEVRVEFEITSTPPVFEKDYFSSLRCVPTVAH